METAKLAEENEHKPVGHSLMSTRKKTARKKADSALPRMKETGSKPKSDKLVCRHCGSNDLAPSFINGGIADVASASVNAMGQPHQRGRRRSRSSLAAT
jgi:hypothetical protein